MHRPSMRHSAIFGSVVAATALGLTGFAGTSFSAAIVGETRYLTVEQEGQNELPCLHNALAT